MRKQSKVQYIFSQILAAYLCLPLRYISIFTILLLSVFVLAPSNSFSQKGSMELSVFAGPNYSDFRGNEVLEEKNDPQVYYIGGFGFQYNIIGNFAIRTNLAYERKGIGSEGMMYDEIPDFDAIFPAVDYNNSSLALYTIHKKHRAS